MSAGGSVTCAVSEAGALYCWGANDKDELGDGSSGPGAAKNVPTRVGAVLGWSSPSANDGYTCALLDSALYCWGTTLGPTPSARALTSSWHAVRAFDTYRHAVRTDGTLWQVLASTESQLPEVAGWTSLAAGFDHQCGLLANQDAECRGGNSYGQLGTGSLSASGLGTIAGPWRTLAAGRRTTFGVHADGTLWAWGQNTSGELGLPPGAAKPTKEKVDATASDWFAVAAGDGFACGLRGAEGLGALYCWGSNSNGQLGVGGGGVTRPQNVVEY